MSHEHEWETVDRDLKGNKRKAFGDTPYAVTNIIIEIQKCEECGELREITLLIETTPAFSKVKQLIYADLSFEDIKEFVERNYSDEDLKELTVSENGMILKRKNN